MRNLSWIPKWSSLKPVLTFKLLRGSYLFVVTIPLVKRLLASIESPLEVTIFSAPIALNLDLPIKWLIFYLASFSIGIAVVLFLSFCPPLIKKFDDPTQYKSTGRGLTELNICGKGAGFMQNLEQEHLAHLKEMAIHPSLHDEQLHSAIDSGFWKIYRFCDSRNCIVRALISLFLVAGLLGYIYNVWEGANYMFGTPDELPLSPDSN